jgi:hypothetical protein
MGQAREYHYLSVDPLVHDGEHSSADLLVTVHDREYSSGDHLVNKLSGESSVTYGPSGRESPVDPGGVSGPLDGASVDGYYSTQDSAVPALH